jgi:hypothetical protein
MAAIANLVLNDQVPVAHTFEPIQPSLKASLWMEKGIAQTIAGNATVVAGIDLASAKRETNKVNLRVAFPIERLDAVSGAYTVVGTARHNGDTILPSVMTPTEILKFEAIVQSAVTNAVMRAMVKTQTAVW